MAAYSEPVEGGMSLSHRLALSDVLNSLQEHLFSILSRQVRRVEFRFTSGSLRLFRFSLAYICEHSQDTLFEKTSRLFNESKIIFLII